MFDSFFPSRNKKIKFKFLFLYMYVAQFMSNRFVVRLLHAKFISSMNASGSRERGVALFNSET